MKRRLLRLWCRLVGHHPASVFLGGCPNSPIGLFCPVYATCCIRCRHELPVPRRYDCPGCPK